MNPLKQWRLANGLTQVQLSAKTGINQRTLSSYELGVTPNKPILRQLRTLGVDISALVTWEPEHPTTRGT